MRVLFWPASLPPGIGGGEVLAGKLVVELRKRGHELMVVTRKDAEDLPDEAQHGGVSVRRFPFWAALQARGPDQLLRTQREVAELRRAFRPELVHIYVRSVGAPERYSRRGPKV